MFLFDEPLSNLDAALRVSTRGEIAALHRRLGATMIYVTHDQVEAMTMGTRICIMNGGRVAQVGAPLEVYRQSGQHLRRELPRQSADEPAAGDRDGQAGRAMPEDRRQRDRAAGRAAALRSSLDRQSPSASGPSMSPQSPGAGAATPIEAEIVRVEPLGAETIVIARLPGVEKLVFARLAGDAIFPIGERRQLFLDVGMAHVFGADGLTLQPT